MGQNGPFVRRPVCCANTFPVNPGRISAIPGQDAVCIVYSRPYCFDRLFEIKSPEFQCDTVHPGNEMGLIINSGFSFKFAEKFLSGLSEIDPICFGWSGFDYTRSRVSNSFRKLRPVSGEPSLKLHIKEDELINIAVGGSVTRTQNYRSR